jgi:hypothetical protein
MRSIVKKNQHLKLNEQDEEVDTTPNFNKIVYIPEEKSVIGAYMIVENSEKMIKVLNIQEELDRKGLFMDGAESYNIHIFFTNLPKSQIEILGPVEGKEGFEFIKIPYWLYKKMLKELIIKRYTGKKRLTITNNQVRNNILELINNPDVERYFYTIDTDEYSHQRFKSFQKHYKP